MQEQYHLGKGFRGAHCAQTGFSLAETAVTLAIIAVVVALSLPTMQRVRYLASESAARRSLHAIGKAEAAWRNNHATYTDNLQDLVAFGLDQGVATGRWYGYNFSIAAADGQSFVGRSSPTGPANAPQEACTIDQTLQLKCGADAIPPGPVRASKLIDR